MARYSGGALSTAGSTTLPIFGIVGSTGVRPKVREIGLYNTTATAVALKLVRFTTAGTPGTAIVRAPQIFEEPAAVATLFNTYTSTGPTLGADLGFRCVLGAAVGSGNIWTFPDFGIGLPAVASAGLGVVVENGTGQACQWYICWDE